MTAPKAQLAEAAARSLLDTQPEVRKHALERLEELYVTCGSGRCVTDPDVARAALPLATRALTDPDAGVRVSGTLAIALLACDAADSIEDLARAIADPEATVRIAALEALSEFGRTARPAADRAAEVLAHAESAEERSAAADVVGSAGAQVAHLELLLEALVRDVPAVQESAAHALGFALSDGSEADRARVSEALHRLAPAAKPRGVE
jgi:HEAT repeat protein